MSYSAGAWRLNSAGAWRLNSAGAWGHRATFRQPRLRPRGGVLNTTLSGITRDSAGAALGTCITELLQSGGDILTQVVISDASGNFTFTNPGSGPFFIRSYKDGAPNLAGVTDRNLTAV